MSPEEHIENFHRRALQDALTTATASYWLRRAATFEAAKPRPGDYAGRSTTDDLRAAWRRCDDMARACRARAKVAPFDDVSAELDAVLEEAA